MLQFSFLSGLFYKYKVFVFLIEIFWNIIFNKKNIFYQFIASFLNKSSISLKKKKSKPKLLNCSIDWRYKNIKFVLLNVIYEIWYTFIMEMLCFAFLCFSILHFVLSECGGKQGQTGISGLCHQWSKRIWLCWVQMAEVMMGRFCIFGFHGLHNVAHFTGSTMSIHVGN